MIGRKLTGALVKTNTLGDKPIERLTLVEFDSAEAQRGWSTQLDHVAAKKQGRQDFYAEYRLQVCEVIRESRFQADDAATHHP